VGHDDPEDVVSTTLDTTAMVALLQRKTRIGLANQDAMDFLNEAFRYINQGSKGGFIWQFKKGTLTWAAATNLMTAPGDFDPGKEAVLRGNGTNTPTTTVIPYLPMKEWVNEDHYQTSFISSWTVYPGTLPAWTVALGGPPAAFTGFILPFWYHAVSFPPLTIGTNFFPTPDQFDSLIVDLAVAEVRSIYRLSGADQLWQKTMASINNIIDTYRTDRYDLAGVTDEVAQAQEKQATRSR
jgi:hypothetical protein